LKQHTFYTTCDEQTVFVFAVLLAKKRNFYLSLRQKTKSCFQDSIIFWELLLQFIILPFTVMIPGFLGSNIKATSTDDSGSISSVTGWHRTFKCCRSLWSHNKRSDLTWRQWTRRGLKTLMRNSAWLLVEHLKPGINKMLS